MENSINKNVKEETNAENKIDETTNETKIDETTNENKIDETTKENKDEKITKKETNSNGEEKILNKKFKFHKDNKNEELERANEKIKSLEDALLRSKADFINYRKRLEEEQARIFKYSNEEVIKSILPTLDNFERAIAMDDENLDDELSKFLSGFKMIYANLVDTLKRYEVTEIDAFHKPFDPTYHQAVLTDKVEGMAPDTVIEVLQKGYMLKDKVIRPAMVRVSI